MFLRINSEANSKVNCISSPIVEILTYYLHTYSYPVLIHTCIVIIKNWNSANHITSLHFLMLRKSWFIDRYRKYIWCIWVYICVYEFVLRRRTFWFWSWSTLNNLTNNFVNLRNIEATELFEIGCTSWYEDIKRLRRLFTLQTDEGVGKYDNVFN